MFHERHFSGEPLHPSDNAGREIYALAAASVIGVLVILGLMARDLPTRRLTGIVDQNGVRAPHQTFDGGKGVNFVPHWPTDVLSSAELEAIVQLGDARLRAEAKRIMTLRGQSRIAAETAVKQEAAQLICLIPEHEMDVIRVDSQLSFDYGTATKLLSGAPSSEAIWRIRKVVRSKLTPSVQSTGH